MLTVKERLFELLNSNRTDEAYDLIEANLHGEINTLKEDAEYCVLAATACLGKEDLSKAFDLITLGLLADNRNYELYLVLGEYYGRSNINQALLCFYQALFYCDVDEDCTIIESYIKDIVSQGATVRQVSIVIVTRNQSEELKRCIDSIVSTVVPEMFEIVIVDNSSNDDTNKWASKMEGISYWISKEDLGYVKSVNEGIRIAGSYNDILLLDADCVMVDNTLFYLMLGLYSEENIGVIGGITNDFLTEQKMSIGTTDFEEAKGIVASINCPMKDACERTVYVSDHAMLIRREAIEKNGIMDERFSPDTYEDKDFCTRVNISGMSVMLCFNSFVFKNADRHQKYDREENLVEKNKSIFFDKWGFNIDYSNNARDGIIQLIKADSNKAINVLELGCAMGSTLNRIKRLWPYANVQGIEYDKAVVRVAENMGDIIQGDVETMVIPYSKGQFDYIICADVLEHLRDPQGALKRFAPYLKNDGHFIISLPNIRHYAVIMMLALEGRFDYSADGILDATHLRFFTRDTAKEMIEGAGLSVVNIQRNYNGHPEDNEYIATLRQSFDVHDPEELKVFQYYFVAKKND